MSWAKIFYDDNFRGNYITRYLQKLEKKIQTPEIKIKNFSFDKKILSFTITDYLMHTVDKDKGVVGRMKVRIRLIDSGHNPLFDQFKTFTAQKGEMKISLDFFKKIKKGEYRFLIDAADLLTGKEASFHTGITVKR